MEAETPEPLLYLIVRRYIPEWYSYEEFRITWSTWTEYFATEGEWVPAPQMWAGMVEHYSQSNDQIMEVDCKSFSESIDRVSTISNEKFRTVKFDVSNNVCVVSSFGTEKSIGIENVKVGYSGPAFSINFNSRYVLDVLNIIKEGKVKFFFSKDTAPTILETPSIKNSLFLIMQMRA